MSLFCEKYLFESGVKPFSVLVENHCVGISVEFFETQARIILSLNFLDCVFEQLPDVLHVLLVHRHGEGPDPHLALLLGHTAFHHLRAEEFHKMFDYVNRQKLWFVKTCFLTLKK